MTELPDTILACPKCCSTTASGLNASRQYCSTCDTQFFDLDGMPCWFPAGTAQKYLWEDLLAKFIEHATEAEKAHLKALSDIQHLPATRRKLSLNYSVANGARRSVIQILRAAGLRPLKRREFENFTPLGLFQYFELMLRDWAWTPIEEDGYRVYENENAMALDALRRALDTVNVGAIERVLVIGSGAGRLSWDLHQTLRPVLTLALDKHPLLAYVSKRMVRDGATIELPEARLYPRKGLSAERLWKLRSPDCDPELRGSWHVMAADAWSAPLQPESFDLILTPWFADINGRDCKDLIDLVAGLLKPGGCWLNHGPFLYPDDLPDSLKYTPEELRQLLQMSGFDMLHDHFRLMPYTWSPLSERGRSEEVWTFMARSPSTSSFSSSTESAELAYSSAAPPAWMILPHLPVPAFADSRRFPDTLQNITALMDGTRSINDIAEILAPNLPEGVSAKGFVYDFFKEYLLTSR